MTTVMVAAVVLTATVAAAMSAHRARTAGRRLDREQAVGRLTGAVHHRDVCALKGRLRTVRQAHDALGRADRILIHAFVRTRRRRARSSISSCNCCVKARR